MARDWEAGLRSWASPPSAAEQSKCENAERMTREAVRASRALTGRRIEIFTQGSYRNNTNVRLDSDVDICVRCMDVVFDDYSLSGGLSRFDTGITPATYTYPEFKHELGEALIARFGAGGVTRGNKAFDVHANTYRLDADVVPTFEHRRYSRQTNGSIDYLSGTELRPDNGPGIINWPHQHAENGITKNKATGGRFKVMVRALKRLRNEMDELGYAVATPIPSYLVECLVWNAPNEAFGHPQYLSDMRWILAHLFNNTREHDACAEWGEVNELKYLFRPSQPWSREQAHAFVSTAWDYIGFQ
jgi:hypothetical protein